MPKALLDFLGYMFFFWSNEGTEPPHIHVSKGAANANATKFRITKDGSVIFYRENGTRYTQGTFRKTCYYSALEAAGVRRLTPHATRHTFASRLATAGVDSVTIQKLMGHADYAVTANTYTHVDVATLKTAVNQL